MSSQTLPLKIQAGEVNNTYIVKFPTNGQFVDIEVVKSKISASEYLNLIRTNTMFAAYAADLVDTVAYFTVLVPELLKDLKKDILQLDLLESVSLVKAYREQFAPWYNSWMTLFTAATQEDSNPNLSKANEPNKQETPAAPGDVVQS